MGLRDLLIELSEASGVSGSEEAVRSILIRELTKYADEVTVSRLGSVVALKKMSRRPSRKNGAKTENPSKILIEAHMDEIGLIVTALEKGFIRFTQIGGFDPRVLPSQNVIVHGRSNLPGVIGSRPPHVLNEEERNKTTPLVDLFIDVGLTEARLAEEVAVGDIITIDRRVVGLRNGILAGKAFDDRAGVATIVEAMKHLNGALLPWDVYAVANVQEEFGSWYPGAFTTAFKIRPDVAIAVEVTHGDQAGVKEHESVPLENGPEIAIGPNVHPRVHQKLVEVARQNEMSFHVAAYSGETGTDAWAMQVAGEGIPTGLVEIPLRYMHSSVEAISINDLERTARLLAEFALSLDDEFLRAISGQEWVSVSPRTVKDIRRGRRVKKQGKGT